eukprot:jgi/Hompol1/6098/HPOL_000358-RA
MSGFCGVFSKRLFPAGVILSFVYWVLDTIEAHRAFEWFEGFEQLKYYVAKVFWCLIPITLVYLVRDRQGKSKGKSKSTSNSDSDSDSDNKSHNTGTPGGIYLCFVAFVYVNMAFFQKPMGGIVLGLAFLQLLCLIDTASILRHAALVEYQHQLQTQKHKMADRRIAHVNDDAKGLDVSGLHLLYTVILLLAGQRAFFSTGHQNALPSIQYELGFVGLADLNWVLSPFFIALNTWGGPIAAIQMIVYHGIVSGSEVASATLFAGWFRKHSQAWRVWGPKFLFFSIGHCGMLVVGILTIGVLALVLDN